MEDTIVDMTTSEQSTESERAAHTNDMRQLEERAKAAEERYGREVLAHAEAIKTAETLRQQVGKAEAAARSNLTAGETAQAKLATSEASWKQQRDALDKEISDLQVRCVTLSDAFTMRNLTSQQQQRTRSAERYSAPAPGVRQLASSEDPPSSRVFNPCKWSG